ncbi:hypothetical protein AQJ43_11310 [Streptomyces avermitilis]|uniref:LysR substrate-binding domain-containing protein n=2 Tax=Streptomyces avermitilis TaxID=33903 RepID=Q82P92_STRAW|nr:LysR substrate-binding domain-containing protein [Streptomyces avermitilis]MYS96673.1 hypothetical protein [Streptomyces sp. SID5469]KUN54835.1 hypothetical protein AQJ43_11310 [Streptomyces avermitilis]OOV21478.1 hypothetical protein SM007_33885 [Streptomyces avermitilis]BAC68751.1 hypothetical protein SAVERM_1041 [Streptomyces avermitilis MA-4680 = NBRC 14893]BBJ48670.1 hypothetical protein SAVMC3_12990 [Streptomyces avermitilis]
MILPHAGSALAATDAICDAATRHDATTGGTVRLAADPTVRQGLLPSLPRHWSEHLPAIRVRVFEGSGEETETWLASAAADAAVVVDPPAGSGAQEYTPAHRVRDLGTLISMAQAGLGVSILPEVSRPLIPRDLVLVRVAPHHSRRLAPCGPRKRPWPPQCVLSWTPWPGFRRARPASCADLMAPTGTPLP